MHKQQLQDKQDKLTHILINTSKHALTLLRLDSSIHNQRAWHALITVHITWSSHGYSEHNTQHLSQGAVTHQDFSGNKGTIKAGDLQLMTAGRGIVHSEMPAGEGVHRGLQLWINLSSKDKMMEPRYQELQSKDIREVEEDGVHVRIIAGEAFGVLSPIYTQTPTMFLDFTMKPGAQLEQHIPDTWTAFAYILEGEAVFGIPPKRSSSSVITSHHAVVLSLGDVVAVRNASDKTLRFVLIGGQPLNEPVVQYGPFVMNTEEEIQKTIEDYHLFRNGFENAKHWKSSN